MRDALEATRKKVHSSSSRATQLAYTETRAYSHAISTQRSSPTHTHTYDTRLTRTFSHVRVHIGQYECTQGYKHVNKPNKKPNAHLASRRSFSILDRSVES